MNVAVSQTMNWIGPIKSCAFVNSQTIFRDFFRSLLLFIRLLVGHIHRLCHSQFKFKFRSQFLSAFDLSLSLSIFGFINFFIIVFILFFLHSCISAMQCTHMPFLPPRENLQFGQFFLVFYSITFDVFFFYFHSSLEICRLINLRKLHMLCKRTNVKKQKKEKYQHKHTYTFIWEK